MFTVSVVAADRKLVTKAEAEAILGASASITDALLLQLSDMISLECGVAAAGLTPPTLRQETIVETFRLRASAESLRLARRFVGTISSLTEDGVALTANDYTVDAVAGVLYRLDPVGDLCDWPPAKVVITYTAGFATVPTDLKLAAVRVLQEQLSATARDPLVRSEIVEGVGRIDYWVNSASSAKPPRAIAGAAAAMLDPYRNALV